MQSYKLKKYRVMIASLCKINLQSFALILFMIHELYTSVVSCFAVKVITKNMVLF